MNIINFIKKNWLIILLILVTILFVLESSFNPAKNALKKYLKTEIKEEQKTFKTAQDTINITVEQAKATKDIIYINNQNIKSIEFELNNKLASDTNINNAVIYLVQFSNKKY
jgi:hypothetical protein